MSQPRDLVLGAIRNYSFEELAPFVESLRRTDFHGDIVLLWNEIDPAAVGQLERLGVRMIPFAYRGDKSGSFNSWSRFWPMVKPWLWLPTGDGFRRWVYRQILNLAFVRYIHALDFLERQKQSYRGVLWADVRDVIFQDNPFRDGTPSTIAAFLESDRVVYGSHPRNDSWIFENYGGDVLDPLRGCRVSCCGTVIGTHQGMLQYLQRFVDEIRHLRSIAHGADTSVHNVLIRLRLRDTVEIFDLFDGIVGTIGSNLESDLHRNEGGLILGSDGRPQPVLHQYDRFPALGEHLIRMLR